MKLLVLYGVNCTKEIWQKLDIFLSKYEVDYVEYPHEMTQSAESVEDITKWVYDTYKRNSYDAVIGHSLGGIVALMLATQYNMKFHKIIYLDTNLKPANEFYRNLLTAEHMDRYGQAILSMFQTERKFYTQKLLDSLQKEFDYTCYIKDINQKVYAVYGDRNLPDYPNRIADLNLPDEVLDKLEIKYIHDACHMIMVENPEELAKTLNSILASDR